MLCPRHAVRLKELFTLRPVGYKFSASAGNNFLIRTGPGNRVMSTRVVEAGTSALRGKIYSRLAPYCVYFVHAGNIIVLIAINQTDMMNLRCFSVVATCLGIGYNLLQPKPLLAPAAWGVFFIACHLYRILGLLRERRHLTLHEAQEEAYGLVFKEHGFTRRQFLDVLEAASGRWHTFAEGEYVHRKGDERPRIHCILDGEVTMISVTNDAMAKYHPGKGGWLGEFYDPCLEKNSAKSSTGDGASQLSWQCTHKAADWSAERPCMPCRTLSGTYPTLRCERKDGCKTLSFLRSSLRDALKANPRIELAATKAEVQDLWGKVCQAVPESRRRTYYAMLEMATISGKIDHNQMELLNQFRVRHNISDAEHAGYLEKLGWTVQRFEHQCTQKAEIVK